MPFLSTSAPDNCETARIPSTDTAATIPSRAAAVHSPSLPAKAKGSNFSSVDDTALAAAWIETTRITTEQNSDTFWTKVSESFISDARVAHKRSSGSLKNRWGTIQRITQKFLAAERVYRANPQSGETEEDAQKNIITFYLERNKVTKDGVTKLAPVIKFMGAIELLSDHPKFSSAVGGGSSSSAPRYRSTSIESISFQRPYSSSFAEPEEGSLTNMESPSPSVETGAGNIPLSSPSLYRPVGAKRQKTDTALDSAARRMAISINKVGDAIRFSAIAKKQASALGLRYKMLRDMNLDEDTFRNNMESLMEEAKALGASSEINNTDSENVSN